MVKGFGKVRPRIRPMVNENEGVGRRVYGGDTSASATLTPAVHSHERFSFSRSYTTRYIMYTY